MSRIFYCAEYYAVKTSFSTFFFNYIYLIKTSSLLEFFMLASIELYGYMLNNKIDKYNIT